MTLAWVPFDGGLAHAIELTAALWLAPLIARDIYRSNIAVYCTKYTAWYGYTFTANSPKVKLTM